MSIVQPTKEERQKVWDRWAEAGKRADKIVAEKPLDPVYLEWQKVMGDQLWNKDSKYVPHLIQELMNVDMCRLWLALPDTHRDPSWGRDHLGVTEQFAKDLGLDTETADRYLQELMEKGFVNPTRNGYQRQRGMQMVQNATSVPKYIPTQGTEANDLVLACLKLELQQKRFAIALAAKEGGLKPPRGKIRPRWKAIKDIPGILPEEDIREIVKKHTRWGVVQCPCATHDQDRTCTAMWERCIVFDGSVAYSNARGYGRELTLKEMFDVIDEMGKDNIVHFRGGEAGFCCCHWDCCLSMTAYYMPGAPAQIWDWLDKSRFRATVDPEKCIGCGMCANDKCQFEAAQMKYYPEFGAERAYIDEDKCMGCGLCVEFCTVGARGMKIVEPPENVLEEGAGGGMLAAAEMVVAREAREKAEKE